MQKALRWGWDLLRTLVERYKSQGYINIDPVILGCLQKFHPVNWKNWTGQARLRAVFCARRLILVLEIRVINPDPRTSWAIALFTVNHTCSDDEWEKSFSTRGDFILIAHMFNKKALELEPGKSAEPAQSLSPRETET